MAYSILIVDDDNISSTLLSSILKQNGYNVVAIANNGEEGVKIAEENAPDLILMDIYMPGKLDGIEASSIIREKLNIPVVFITGDDDQKTFSRALKTNPTGYILKPFQKENLIMVLEMAIFRHQITERLRKSEQLLSITMRSIADAVISTNTKGELVFCNDAASKLTGLSTEENTGEPLTSILELRHPDGYLILGNGDNAVSLEPTLHEEGILTSRSSSPIPISYSLSQIRDDEGKLKGQILTFRDISRLKQAEQELRNMNVMLEEKVIERTEELRQKNILLERALEKEKEINDFRAKIVTTISHEFKTPLTTVYSSTELIERYINNEKLRPKAERHISLIKESVNLLTNHLKDVLKYKEYESLKKVNLESIAPEVFFDKMLDFYRTGVGKNHQLFFIPVNLPAEMSLDKKLMNEITGNFISNAIKYSPQGSTITLKVENIQSHLKVSVQDEGVGISVEDQKKLFEYFYRAKTTENVEGSGVGLAIAKHAVELLDGEINIDSKHGEGSVFSFAIPMNL